MSIQADILKTETKFEALMIAVLSFIFAMLTILFTILLLDLFELDIGGEEDSFKIIAELYKYSIVEVVNEWSDLGEILDRGIPLALTGLAVAIAFKAGLFNIGGQGQMMIGGCFAGIWGAAIVPDPKYHLTFLDTPILMVPTILLVAFLFGGIWGFIPGFLKAHFGAHEVITTILMNLIAFSFATYLVGTPEYSPFVDLSSENAFSQTDVVADSARMSVINDDFSSALTYYILVAIIAITIAHLLIFKAKFGFRLRAVGLNKEAAETAGINSKRVTILAMFYSGGFAGLAGAYTVLTFPYRFRIGNIGTTGFDGIAVALIGQNAPIGVAIAAILFGYLSFSRSVIERKSLDPPIPKDIVFIFQAWIILFTAAPLIARRLMNVRKTPLVQRLRADSNELQEEVK
ncbi:MAG: ABC transporter permease [Candidatus Kariarchaeaceae archaeon]|jgi:simple sugar transport system permease protein